MENGRVETALLALARKLLGESEVMPAGGITNENHLAYVAGLFDKFVEPKDPYCNWVSRYWLGQTNISQLQLPAADLSRFEALLQSFVLSDGLKKPTAALVLRVSLAEEPQYVPIITGG